ncbi:MAG: DUF3472 domain-containing protein [Akkermansiaceae bacterium]|nr:DUF3472 domain-containing protein [Akkermansiaceae bacterium]
MKALIFLPFLLQIALGKPLSIPAFTAYLGPDPNGARVSKGDGITDWNTATNKIKWSGQLKNTGDLSIQVRLTLKKNEPLELHLKLGDQFKRLTVTGTGVSMLADFGELSVTRNGYHTFILSSPAPSGKIEELTLDGPPAKDAHFNFKPRRNSASVHLSYPIEREEEISAFYCELTGIEEPLWTYYMACGWHRGYFGMQINSPTERRIIFSVWDSGGEAADRNKVGQEDRVTLIAKGESVNSGSFGNEGTGGHSHLKYQWETGVKQRFLVTAEPVDSTHTIFAGYYFHPEKKTWILISSWKAPKEGKRLRGLYSFSENFAGKNGNLLRKASYGNQWVRTSAGEWKEITTAKFSHDETGKADRLDRFMGLTKKNEFFLSQGGFVEGFTKFGTPFERKPSKRSPKDMNLPPLPPIKK